MSVWLVGALIGCGAGEAPIGGEPVGPDGPGGTPEPEPEVAVDGDGDGFDAVADCDDADPDVYPGAPDVCGDGRVTDCRRTSDDGLVNLDGVGYGSLQDALDAAASGSALVLCPGTYVGAFEANVPVQIAALEDASTTALSGPSGTVLTVTGGTTVTGLTIRDGTDGGLRVDGQGALTVTGCTITGNRAPDGGGLQVAPGAAVTLVATDVIDNRAERGGGGAWVAAGATLELTAGSRIVDNEAQKFGGGVWLDGAHLIGGVLSGNTVADADPVGWDGLENVAAIPGIAWGGTAIAMVGDASVTGSEVTGNVGACAAVAAVEGSAVLQDVSIHANVGEAGGGVGVVAGTLTLLGATEVADNEAQYGAGGFAVGGTLVGGTYSGGSARVGGGVQLYGGELRDAVVVGNVSTQGGGGIAAVDAVLLSGLTVTGNVADEGGGIHVGPFSDPAAPTTIIGCIVSGNDAARGGGLAVARDLTVSDTTIADNTATTGAGVAATAVAPDLVSVDVTMTGGAIVRNVADEGAGGVDLIDATFDASAVDLGAGADDNLPSDVVTGDGAHAYGADATFACDGDTCG